MKLERVKVIYDEICKYEIKLEPDPRSLGPLYLQNVIAECRNYLNLVSRFQLEVHREKQELARHHRAAEATYEIAFAELLSNDERVRRLPSIEDRKATANVVLREMLNAITAFKAELQDLEFVEKAIRHRHKELTSTMGEIKLQRSLIRDEIDSGAMYGDERKGDHERGTGPLGRDEIDEKELDDLFREQVGTPDALEPSPAPVAAPSVGEPVTQNNSEDAAIKAFLESGTVPVTAVEEDFTEVFDRL